METINLRINGIAVTAPKGSTVLEAARLAHIEVPALRSSKEANETGACCICIVELKDGKLVTSCIYPAGKGIEVYTNIPKALDPRKETSQLLLSNHDRPYLSCARGGHCELQELTHELGVDDEGYYDGEITPSEIGISAAHMIRDNSKYVLCRRCVAVCENVQGTGVIGANNRGFSTSTSSAFEIGPGETSYISCGQCIVVCSAEVLIEKDYIANVFAVTADSKKHIIVQAALAAHAGLGEEFGLPIDTDVEGKMAAVLRRLGLDKIFDINLSADLTIMEEAHEFIDQVQNGGVLLLITSYSPDWVKHYEHYFPDMTENLSSCKPPQRVFGTIAKSHYAEKAGIDPKDIVSVNVMPCIVKKSEIDREDEGVNGMSDVDTSITTRELARMIKEAGIRFLDPPDEEFDAPPGLGTGAAVILGVTGGVVETALRTAVRILTGEGLLRPDFTEARGAKGIRKATYNVASMEMKITVTSGLGSARELLNKVKSGEANYHSIEIMGCPDGCVNGGGQPQQLGHVRSATDIRGLHTKVLYDIDTANPICESHEDPVIKEPYTIHPGEPGSKKAHHLLHATHVRRNVNQH